MCRRALHWHWESYILLKRQSHEPNHFHLWFQQFQLSYFSLPLPPILWKQSIYSTNSIFELSIIHSHNISVVLVDYVQLWKKMQFPCLFFLHRLSQFRFSNSFKGRFPFKYTIRNGFYSNGFYLKTFDLYLQLWRFYGKIKWNKIEWQKNNQGKINKETQPVH